MPSTILTRYQTPTHARHGPGRLLRLRVWFRRFDLDLELAKGVDPNQSRELALRASELTSDKNRDRHARRIERAVAIADDHNLASQRNLATSDTSVQHWEMPAPEWQILGSRSLLLELADRLRSSEPTAVGGLAKVDLLVMRGRGLLFTSTDARTLMYAVDEVSAALDRVPRHTNQPGELQYPDIMEAESSSTYTDRKGFT